MHMKTKIRPAEEHRGVEDVLDEALYMMMEGFAVVAMISAVWERQTQSNK